MIQKDYVLKNTYTFILCALEVEFNLEETLGTANKIVLKAH